MLLFGDVTNIVVHVDVATGTDCRQSSVKKSALDVAACGE